jgi:hypothetical protein
VRTLEDGLPTLDRYAKPHCNLGAFQIDPAAGRNHRLTTRGDVGFEIIAADMFGPFGLDPAIFVTGVAATLVAWDVGQHAITIGEQFGRQAPTRRGEIVHAGGSVMVGVLASGLAYGIYLFGSGNQPTLAVALLMFGAVLLIWALRD